MKPINIKLNLFCILVLFEVITGCTKENKDMRAFLKLASTQNKEYPDLYSSLILFGKCDSESVFVTNTYELGRIHRREYSNMNYEDFLVSILSQETSVELCRFPLKRFHLNSAIYTKYKKEGVNSLLSAYFTHDKENLYLMKGGLQEDKIHTILFLLFKNDYIGGFGDYSGKFYVQPVRNILDGNPESVSM